MSVDLNDPKMEGYLPLQDFIDNDQDQSSRRIRDMPYGKPREELQISSLSIDFEEVVVATEAVQAIILTSTGWDKVNIFGYEVVGPFTLKSDPPSSLEPGETAIVQISFIPTELSAVTGGIYFDTGNAAGDEYVELSGEGVLPSSENAFIIDGGTY